MTHTQDDRAVCPDSKTDSAGGTSAPGPVNAQRLLELLGEQARLERALERNRYRVAQARAYRSRPDASAVLAAIRVAELRLAGEKLRERLEEVRLEALEIVVFGKRGPAV
jgi:hypothetical protein